MTRINTTVARVTERIRRRSQSTRLAYLDKINTAAASGPRRGLACSNLAHGFAACSADDKAALPEDSEPELALVAAEEGV